MTNDGVAFKSWLDAYGKAWETRNPEAAAALFTENGTYQVTPFLEPMRGRKPFSSIGQRWPKPRKTSGSGMWSWLRMVSLISPDGRRRSFVYHQDYKLSWMASS